MRTFLVTVATIFIYIALRETYGYDLSTGETILFLAVLLPILHLIGTPSKILDEKADQETRNYAHQKRLPKDFSGILFLRPFSLDSRFRVSNPRKHSIAANAIIFYKLLLPEEATLDDAIRIQVRRHGELLSLGRPDEAIGATRHTTDDDNWRADFKSLAHTAKGIILIVSTQNGLAWELEQICSSRALLSKTIFILPPAYANSEIGFDRYEDAIEILRIHLSFGDEPNPGDGIVFNENGEGRLRAAVLGGTFYTPRLHQRSLARLLDRIASHASDNTLS